MIRKALTLALLLATVSAYAQNRGHAVPAPSPLTGATVTGFVTAVNGSQVSLANGLVVIDASQATVTDDRGHTATITPGSLIFAVMKSTTSLQAATVVVSNTPQVALSGPVQAVNASAGTLQVLGLTIHTDNNTSIGGSHSIRTLNDIVTGDLVAVQANAVNGALVASSILVFAPLPQIAPTLLHGTVKSIGSDSWVITDSRRGDVTVAVNAQTKILGSPKVGDTVDVIANVDSANNYVAIAISISLQSLPVPTHITGVVKSITPHTTLEPCPISGCIVATWDIARASGSDVQVVQTAQTKIIGSPKVGDTVDVLANVDASNNLVAISIAASSVSNGKHITGTVKQISDKFWVIGPSAGLGPDTIVQVNSNTKIDGDPKVGDRVDVLLDPNSALNVALSITKL